jgi:hypothetical protein
MTDPKRLGKRGAYQLGQLRAPSIREPAPPAPFRPRFARRPRRMPVLLWILLFVVGAVVIALGTAAGVWFAPFVAGLLAGLAIRLGGWRTRTMLADLSAMAVAGWGIPLMLMTLHGQPTGAVARVIAALAGLPGYAAVGIALTLLIALIQAIAGFWLGRALAPGSATTH